MEMLSGVLALFGVCAIFFVMSGYKQSVLEDFSPAPSPTAHTDGLLNNEEKNVEKNVEKDCNPGFDCRRVGFYCSLID